MTLRPRAVLVPGGLMILGALLAGCPMPAGYYGPGYGPTYPAPTPTYPTPPPPTPGPAQNTGGGQIFPGQTITGALAPGDAQLNSGEWFDEYTLFANAGQSYDIEMDSNQFDTYLIVVEPGGQQVDNDDRSGTNAGLAVTATASGSMRIRATSYAAGQGGAYQLSVGGGGGYAPPPPTPPPPTPPPPQMNSGGGPINSGQTCSGVLTAGDPQLNSGEWFDEYTVNVAPGTTVNVSMNSSAFDTYLIVMTPDGQQSDNDDANGTNSALSVTATTPGTVRIRATTYQPGQGGPYTIRADISGGYLPPPPPPVTGGNAGGGWINMGQTASGTLSPGDMTLPTGEFYDTYQFNVMAGQTVHLRANSGQFDTYLIFTDPSQQQQENDDMSGTNAGLDAYCAGGGTARVIVTSYQAGEQGAYTLQVY